MSYGLIRTLPQQNDELVRRISIRWLRAADPHYKWAKLAKKCVNFLEGNQWTEEQLAYMASVKRNALTINKMNTLYRLIIGYQSSNRMDVTFLPTNDAQSREDTAELLTNVFKSESNRTDLKFIDSDVFGDGLSTGRGFWDQRLCFEDNDFGVWKPTSSDPFSTYIDPDASAYDLEETAGYITESVFTDLDYVEATYGTEAAERCEYLFNPSHSFNLPYLLGIEDEVSPKRYFGQWADDKGYKSAEDLYYSDFIDRQAKKLRIMDSQYKVTKVSPCFIDLETGDKQVIPDDWLKPENQHKIQKSLEYAEKIGNPLQIANRPIKRIRWTVTCGDIILHDDWSPFKTYTKVGYFPYFRRGKTRGMLEDLLDPQMEMNKKRSVMDDILNRNANSGWMYEENTLDQEQEENLKKYGATPGINIKWKRVGSAEAPKRIEPGAYPQGLDRLEEKASMDLHEVSGINESALGQLDRVQSGRAIEARQRQAVLSVQPYIDNFARSKKLQARNALSIFQCHYTEQRVFRILGEDSRMSMKQINLKQMEGISDVDRLASDITVGKYDVTIDEVPISATFKQAQFEETMMLLEKLGPIGMMLAQVGPELIVDQTSLPRKQEWKEKLLMATQMMNAQQAQQQALPPPGGGAPVAAPTTPEMVAS